MGNHIIKILVKQHFNLHFIQKVHKTQQDVEDYLEGVQTLKSGFNLGLGRLKNKKAPGIPVPDLMKSWVNYCKRRVKNY